MYGSAKKRFPYETKEQRKFNEKKYICINLNQINTRDNLLRQN